MICRDDDDDGDDDDMVQLQANVKAYLTRKNYTNKLDFYKQHVRICVCISQTVSSHLSGGSLVREFFFYRVRVRVRVSRVSRVGRVSRV